MMRHSLQHRLTRLAAHQDPPLPHPFVAFARAVIVFGGAKPTPEAVDQLARWYAGG
jgi:hypothetical protein